VRVLLVQESVNPPGGGNAVAAWMLQALAGAHDVATLTSRPWNANAVDRFYGTSLRHARIAQLHPPALTRIVDALPLRLSRLRMAVLFRSARQLAGDFDLLLTADNYAAFGRRGLQYVHYPIAFRPEPRRWHAVMRAYYGLCDAISGHSFESARVNETLANSDWTAKALRAEQGLAARVLYPPVVNPGCGRPWPQRTDTFLCIGRFDQTKRFELAIAIVERVRSFLPTARLHIIGSRVHRRYRRRIMSLAQRFADWVTVEEDVSQEHLLALLCSSRYGVHAMEREHFGMAVAEMARAGCVVFVHDSGGQVEAVGDIAELRWRTADDAVERIRHVTSTPALQEEFSARLRCHAERFSSERFVREFSDIAANFSRSPSRESRDCAAGRGSGR
jgi:glycosyltransferase involved in cell wall biosynthesis